MNTEMNKKEKDDFEKKKNLRRIQFSEKLWNMFENIVI